MYDMGKMRAEPHGAAEIVPRGWDCSGAGMPPVETCNIGKRDNMESIITELF